MDSPQLPLKTDQLDTSEDGFSSCAEDFKRESGGDKSPLTSSLSLDYIQCAQMPKASSSTDSGNDNRNSSTAALQYLPNDNPPSYSTTLKDDLGYITVPEVATEPEENEKLLPTSISPPVKRTDQSVGTFSWMMSPQTSLTGSGYIRVATTDEPGRLQKNSTAQPTSYVPVPTDYMKRTDTSMPKFNTGTSSSSPTKKWRIPTTSTTRDNGEHPIAPIATELQSVKPASTPRSSARRTPLTNSWGLPVPNTAGDCGPPLNSRPLATSQQVVKICSDADLPVPMAFV